MFTKGFEKVASQMCMKPKKKESKEEKEKREKAERADLGA